MSTEIIVSATGWKHLKLDDENFVYIVQVDKVKGKRTENKILKQMGDWMVCGEGFSPRTQEKTFIFKRTFSNEKEWIDWARTAPFYLKEISSRSSKEKPYKLGLDYINRRKNVRRK